jgi:protein TonB
MIGTRYQPDGKDRARAAGATLVVHALLAATLVTDLALHPQLRREDAFKTFDVEPPLPPPPVIEKPKDEFAKKQAAPDGRKANPSPIVAPPARIPVSQPVQASPVAGQGASADAGSGTSGAGTGAGGESDGRGGGGNGIGTEARLLSGNRSRVPRHLLRQFMADRGYANLLLTVSDSGRVTDCRVLQTSGSPDVDQVMCGVMMGQSQWAAARDREGRPITVQVRYTATWSKD